MKSSIEVIWEAPPSIQGYASKFDEVVNALLTNPGKWIKLPEPSNNSNSGLRSIINNRKLPIKIATRSRPDGKFDIYAVCVTDIATNALDVVPDEEGYNA